MQHKRRIKVTLGYRYSWNIERVRVLLAGSLASSYPVVIVLKGNLARTMDLIADINATKLSWSLVMGVVRLYDFPSQWNENEVFSLEMVLQDVKGDRIQATISKPTLEVFRHQIMEHAI
ncbi:hypothetical protein Ahy_A04g018728 isoform A [Arachis hypogaea]|uniref:Replication protein A 70 kDa DNA-binding subunit B/D first OB fold domain-containing protein n=1 Tax=Arachis hypogaea TaxID=3818 RepID=A0A445DEG2_ARAHY|nr:hypothetical protein Ahy_A04g018728 isoform A [Arachis hypogaea]